MKTSEPRRAGRRPGKAGEQAFEGLGVAPGVAIGVAHRSEAGVVAIPEYEIAPDQVDAEKRRFADAVARAQKQLAKLKAKSQALSADAAEELGYLLDAHAQILAGSRLVRGVITRIETQRQKAEAAVRAVIAEITEGFAQIDDAYLSARQADVRDVGERVITLLTRRKTVVIHVRVVHRAVAVVIHGVRTVSLDRAGVHRGEGIVAVGGVGGLCRGNVTGITGGRRVAISIPVNIGVEGHESGRRPIVVVRDTVAVFVRVEGVADLDRVRVDH